MSYVTRRTEPQERLASAVPITKILPHHKNAHIMLQEEKILLEQEELKKRIENLEEEVAHLKGEMTDQDVENCIQNGLDKERFSKEYR